MYQNNGTLPLSNEKNLSYFKGFVSDEISLLSPSYCVQTIYSNKNICKENINNDHFPARSNMT